jgi:hypothetical protein
MKSIRYITTAGTLFPNFIASAGIWGIIGNILFLDNSPYAPERKRSSNYANERKSSLEK